MNVQTTAIRGALGQSARREHILDAAEACFVRNGFHRTTMQDIAREAAMSAGNIYRYFDSKEAVVFSLAERERAHAEALLETLKHHRDRRAVLKAVISQFFVETSRETAILRVDLLSEATRNPTIADLTLRQEHEGRTWLIDMLSSLATSPQCDVEALYEVIDPMMKGILVSRALLPGYDPAAAMKRLFAVMDAGLNGTLLIATADAGANP